VKAQKTQHDDHDDDKADNIDNAVHGNNPLKLSVWHPGDGMPAMGRMFQGDNAGRD
jgi:hypothetical protein